MMAEMQMDFTRTSAPTFLNAPRAKAELDEAGVDCLIATSPENVAYLSGYYCQTHWNNKGTLAFAWIANSQEPRPMVIAPALELDAWAEHPPAVGEFRPCGTSGRQIGREVGLPVDELSPDDRFIFDHGLRDETHPSAIEILVDALKSENLFGARIALDESGLTYKAREQVLAALAGSSVVDGAGILRRIRMVKTETEVDLLSRSVQLTFHALGETMAAAVEGATEQELLSVYNLHLARGGGKPSFAAISAGRRSGHPHPIASDYVLKKGDVVKYDVGCTLDLYHSDVGRTQIVGGHPSEEQLRIYQALLAGEQAGIAAIKPGVRPSQVFAAAMEAVRGAGIPDYKRHHVGHGIGIEVYDPPLLQPAVSSTEISGLGGSDEPLEEGMVLNVEAPYYVLGRYGMIVEDTLVVTKNGTRYLAEFPRQLT